MLTFGETVRYIRQQKGITQKNLYDGIISKSYGVHFEQGTHDISFFLLQKILSRLSMRIDEFEYIHRGYTETPEETLKKQYEQLANLNDISGLKKLTNDIVTEGNYSPLVVSVFRAKIEQLEQFKKTGIYTKVTIDLKDVKEIQKHLETVESWNLSEIRLLANTMELIDYSGKMDYFIGLLPSLKKYLQLSRGRKTICVLLVKIIHELIMTNEHKLAHLVLNYLYEFSEDVTEMYFRTAYNFYVGLLTISEGNHEKGKEAIHSALSIYQSMGYSHQANLYHVTYQEFLKHIN